MKQFDDGKTTSNIERCILRKGGVEPFELPNNETITTFPAPTPQGHLWIVNHISVHHLMHLKRMGG